MTKDEALDLALEALEYHTAQTRPIQRTETAITTIKQARSESVQDQIRAITQEAMQKIHDLEDKVRREVYNIPPAAQRQWVEVEQIKWEGDKLIAKLKENT